MQFDPKILDCPKMIHDEIKGSDAIFNADRIIEIFKGKKNEFSQAVALNVAAGLIVSGKESDFKMSYEKATKHLNSGQVYHHLVKIQSN